MIRKGIVMDVQKNHVLVMSEDFEYFKIKPLKCSKGSNIFFTDDDIMKLSGGMRKLIAASAAAVLIIASLLGLSAGFSSPYSYAAVMTLDDGSSVELLLDKDMKVKDIDSNSQATENIAKEKCLGLAVEHAVDAFAENSIQNSYENTIIVSVIPLKSKYARQEETIKNAIYEQLLKDTDIENLNVVYVKSNSKNYNDAKNKGIGVLEYELKASKASKASSVPEYETLGFEVISKTKSIEEPSKPVNPTASENAAKSSKNIPSEKNAQAGSNPGSSKANNKDTDSSLADKNKNNSNGKPNNTNNTNNGSKK